MRAGGKMRVRTRTAPTVKKGGRGRVEVIELISDAERLEIRD